MNSQAQPFYGNAAYAPAPDPSHMLAWEASQMLMEGFIGHEGDLPRLMDLAHNLSCVLENTRARYNSALADRDATYRKLQETDNKLLQIENVVRRYSTVREPVVASDGFTYDRSAITQYLQDCARTNSKAYSQQTKEELTDVLVPNESLRRLVETLKGVRTTEVPQLHPRNPIVGSAVAPRMSAWVDESSNMAINPVGTPNRPAPDAASAPGNAAAGGGLSTAPASAHNGGSGGVAIPAPAGARRFEMGGKYAKHGGPKPALHPCLRVYGFCNFMDDCTFAHYPFEACLNHIKGKCRFGQNCKELHVDPRDPRYQNRNSYAATHSHQNKSQPSHDSTAPKKGADADAKDESAPATDKASTLATSVDANSKSTTPPSAGADSKDTVTKPTTVVPRPTATGEA